MLDPSVHHHSIQKCCFVSADVTFLISEKLEQFSLLFQTLFELGKVGKTPLKNIDMINTMLIMFTWLLPTQPVEFCP